MAVVCTKYVHICRRWQQMTTYEMIYGPRSRGLASVPARASETRPDHTFQVSSEILENVKIKQNYIISKSRLRHQYVSNPYSI